MNKLLKLSLSSLLVVTSHASLADDSMLEQYTYDMIAQNVSKGFEPTANSIKINGSDIYVSYTTWADTAASYNDNDDRVVRQNGLDYSQTYGLAMTNKDHGGGLSDWHTIDNNQDDWKFDFDMVLFSFSEAVALTNTKFNYLTGAGNENQLTVVGFDNIDIFKNASSSVTTWTDIAASSAITSITHKNISTNPHNLGNYEVTYPTSLKEAKYWLVGAYNTYFDPNNDETSISGSGFKLASLGISQRNETPDVDVSEPGAFALMSLGLGLLLYRRKRRV
jgi:hypothetical protein